jgi:phospholipid transport system substrate-binding protein
MLMLAALVGSRAHAQEEAPDALIKRVSQEVLDSIRNDKSLQAGDDRQVQALVENKILPYTNFRRTTSIAVGRYWREATPEQQQKLIDEFRNLLIHTYAGALSQVKDQRLDVRPLRANPSDLEVEVQSQVIQPRAQPIQLDYRLEKTGEGWKIYDINILGAWLTATYKPTFAAEVNRSGIDGLIRMLAEKNRQLANNAGRPQKNAS